MLIFAASADLSSALLPLASKSTLGSRSSSDPSSIDSATYMDTTQSNKNTLTFVFK